jgi:hypothetical protein
MITTAMHATGQSVQVFYSLNESPKDWDELARRQGLALA